MSDLSWDSRDCDLLLFHGGPVPVVRRFVRHQLYDLAPEIPDVMGLRALRASAAIVKVMSVPNSWCIRVVGNLSLQDVS